MSKSSSHDNQVDPGSSVNRDENAPGDRADRSRWSTRAKAIALACSDGIAEYVVSLGLDGRWPDIECGRRGVAG